MHNVGILVDGEAAMLSLILNILWLSFMMPLDKFYITVLISRESLYKLFLVWLQEDQILKGKKPNPIA